MNMVEHYIKEVVSVRPHKEDWTKQYGEEFVEVEVIVNCYGTTERKNRIFELEKWKQVLSEGYFMS